MATALIPLIDGFEETEAVAVIDILRRAGVEVVTAGVRRQSATGSHNIRVEADAVLDEVLDREWDAIVLPGGPGVRELNKVKALHRRLNRQVEEGRIVAAICAAPTILATAGLLDGREAACFPTVESSMGGAKILHKPVVEDGLLITSRGVGTAVDFALTVAGRLAGQAKAIEVARSILHPPGSR